MPTSAEVNQAAEDFIADTVTADAKINGAPAFVTDRHGVTTPNLEKILEPHADIASAVASASTSAANALSSETTALQAAIAAGAPLVTSLTTPVPADGTIEILQVGAGAQVHEVQTGAWVLIGWLEGPRFDTVAGLLADTSSTYGGDGSIVEAGGFRFEQAPTAAVDHNETTAGGVKLYFTSVGYGQDKTQYRTGGGAVRQIAAASGWSFINDTGHEPWGWASTSPVALSGTNLRVTYDFTATEVGTFTVTPDEGYAAIGLTAGASVGRGIADISGFAPISGRIVSGPDGIMFNTVSGNVVSQVVDQAAGTISVTHLVQTHTDAAGSAVMVSAMAGGNTGEFTVASQTKTGFTLQYVLHLSCRIAATDTTPGAEVFTVSETNNIGISAAWNAAKQCVIVTFPNVGPNRPDASVSLSRDAPTRYLHTLDTQAPTSCEVHFYDLTGAKITAVTTSMIFHFAKPGKFPASIPSGSISLGAVQRDMVPVDFNQLNGSSRNLWLSYAHPY